jgi:hypothetical protein
MDGYIGRLHSHYRVVGDCSPGAMQRRLDGLIRSETVAALERNLDRALAGDPRVYVLRRVRVAATVHGGVKFSENRASEYLGRNFAASILAAIASGDPENCIIFPNRAEYLASFLRDLLRDSARDNWVYGALLRFNRLSLAEAARCILLENSECLPGILVALQRFRCLDKVLRLLPSQALEILWRENLCALRSSDSLLPLFTVACEISDRLGIWSSTPAGRHELFQHWAATHCPVPDWGSRTAITAIVVSVLRWFQESGLALVGALSSPVVSQSLTGIDWLETEALVEALAGRQVSRLPETRPEDAPGFLPQPPVAFTRRRATPRQTALLEHILPLLAQFRAVPDSLVSPETRIRLYTLLVAAHPEWTDVEIVAPVIERILLAAAALNESLARAEAYRCLLRGDVTAALRTWPGAVTAQAAAALQLASDIGRPAMDVIAKLAVLEQAPSLELADEIRSECAGIFLLLRAVVSLRLSAACYNAGQVPVAPLLAALTLRWSGDNAIRGDRSMDPAVALFSGWEGTLVELRSFWSKIAPTDLQCVHSALLQIMQSQRIPNHDEHAAASDLDSLSAGALDLPEIDITTALIGCALLRGWARWLRGFSSSSVPFLLKNFIRRPGVVTLRGESLIVRLDPSPLDIALEMPGYFDEIQRTPGLALPAVRFHRSRV